MFRWIPLLAALLALPALAQDTDNRTMALGLQPDDGLPPWTVRGYWQPISYAQGEFVSGPSWTGRPVFSAQLVGGVGGGVRYRQNSKPHLYGFSRAEGAMRYAITHGTTGLGARVGSFFGLDGKWIRATMGPDFWYDVYGLGGFGGDYHLPASPGLSWPVEGTLKFSRDFSLVGTVTPGWAFLAARKRPGLIDLLELSGVIAYSGEFNIGVGWRAQWNVAGRQHGPIVWLQFR